MLIHWDYRYRISNFQPHTPYTIFIDIELVARKLNGLHHINLSARIDFILFLLFFHSIFKHLNRYCWLNCFRRPTLENALRESSTWFGKSNSFCTKAKKSHTHRKYSRTAKCGRIKFYRYNRPHNNRFGVVKFSNLILKLDLIRFDSNAFYRISLVAPFLLPCNHTCMDVHSFLQRNCATFVRTVWIFFLLLGAAFHLVPTNKWTWNSFAE